jgi:hypothetical protein
VDELVVSTVVYLPPTEVYDFLVDFPRYANYSKHLREVRQRGDGTPGTTYELVFSWWKLTYTARSQVTDADRPDRVDWRLTKDLDAHGCWRVERLSDLPADAPAEADVASRVFLEVRFDPDSVSARALDLPSLVSLGWVVRRVKPLIEEEGERVVRRIVADIEGRRREVDLTVHAGSAGDRDRTEAP